ncbi:MAG: type polyketide synthase, partial [Myxococcaceae bacterium]|nr:type polyketide synthase [Myxococcaceae bacterium]
QIAIVGMAGRFPAAASVDALWQLMIEGRDAIAPVPAARWDASEQLDPEKSVQAVGGFLEGVDQFDPMFFGISPREAEEIDPQHRLILEASYRALEDAGVAPSALEGTRTGVYVGASWHDYEILRKERGAAVTQHTAVGNALDMAAARVSYFYKLKGPSLTLETGCSSSLVALHIACQALRSGEIEGAIVGGVNLILAPDVSVGLTHFGGLSPDGRCKAFAASANGFVRGEGVVTLYVKTLERALADGDRIHALIARTEVNNDGGGDSLVTPSPLGQTDLLQRAYGQACIPLDELAYVEAHGTGTSRGDPIEAGAIGRTLGMPRSAGAGPLAVGSLKTNIGHLEAVAGLAGLVKGVLSLEHRLVPRTLHAEALNPNIPFDELNLRVVREPLVLPSEGDVYVGVNSFGWGGTNAHVVLKNAPAVATPAHAADAVTLIALSAQQEESLRVRASELAAALPGSSADLSAVSGTLAHRRAHFAQRAAIVTDSKVALGSTLSAFAATPDALLPELVTGKARPRGKVAFVFPGQGSQWAEMGKQLFASSARFRDVIVRCAEALEPYVSWDLKSFIAGDAGDGWLGAIDTLQPTLWAMSVGLAELWREAGVEPDLVIGHSMGEVAAATVAGMLSYEDAARVIARRSAIAQGKAGRGQMLAVDLGLEAARAALAGFEDRVSLAVNNGPSSCVLSGDTDAIGVLKEILEGEGTFCRLVRVDFASHSQQMDEFKEELFLALSGIEPQPGQTALLSTVLTREVSGAELDASYWVKNLREPVLFADALGQAFRAGVTHVIEISPHPVLTPALEQLAALESDPPSVLSTLRRDEGSERHLTLAFARAYVSGLSPFARLSRDVLAELPGYPLNKRTFWVAPSKRKSAGRSGLDFELAPSAVEQGSWAGELELALDALPWLRDHKVHEAVVLPAAAMMALALSTAVARLGGLPGSMSKVKFSEKLTLADAPQKVSVLFRDDVAEGGSFQLLSMSDDASGGATKWSEHASARIEPAADLTSKPFPAHLLALPSTPVESFYQACVARGLVYGPAFQGVRALYVEGTQALGEIVLPEACRPSARPLGLHAALWDAALQVSLALQVSNVAVVPTEVLRIDLLAPLDRTITRLWSHVERIDDSHFDLTFYDQEQQPLLYMCGLTLLELALSTEADAQEERVHRLVFRETARDSASQTLERWLVYGQAEDGAHELAAALRAGGAQTSLSDELAEPRAGFGEQPRDGNPQAVAFLVPREASVAQHRSTLARLAGLASACAKQPTPPRLVVLTAHAQPVLDDEPMIAASALYWGFMRVLRREHAELSPLVVDLSLDALDWNACRDELLANDGEDQVALRGARRFVA